MQPGPDRQLSALGGGGGHHALLGAAVAVQGAAEAAVPPGQGAHAGRASRAEARAAQLQLVVAPGLTHARAAAEHVLEARPEPGPSTHASTGTHTHIQTCTEVHMFIYK